jgi:hypothetical protein
MSNSLTFLVLVRNGLKAIYKKNSLRYLPDIKLFIVQTSLFIAGMDYQWPIFC